MGYYDPLNHQRRSIRLRGYDYSRPGAYFVTLCTQNRECLFGEIENGKMILNDVGKIVADEWIKSAEIRNEIALGEWVVMPNHFHGIVIIHDGDIKNPFDGINDNCMHCSRGNRPVAPTAMPPVTPTMPSLAPEIHAKNTTHPDIQTAKPGPRPKSIASLMAGFKSAVTVRVNKLRNTPGAKLWQRNYYEHIIRDNLEYQIKTIYIRNNPKNWQEDKLCDNPGK